MSPPKDKLADDMRPAMSYTTINAQIHGRDLSGNSKKAETITTISDLGGEQNFTNKIIIGRLYSPGDPNDTLIDS